MVPLTRTLTGALLLGALALRPATVAAAAPSVSFDAPSATAVLLQPLEFQDTFHASVRPARVELVVSTPYVPGSTVQDASVSQTADGSWQASVTQADTGSVNTVYRYAFRVTLPGGVTVTGPSGSVTVVDRRFAWQAISGATVTLHWYGVSTGTARTWLQAAEAAIRRGAAAFGLAGTVPHLDFFIYNDSASFFDAIGSGANADAAGVYIADTHTAFGTVLPSDLGSDWPVTEIAHEVTHHVFEVATHNPYHVPPLWLDEGLAVYYSEGPDQRAADLQQGISQGRIVPLDGLTGAFPSSTDAFVLSYAEAVSAVDYFLRTHGTAALQRLVATYAHGATDDEAFQAATGGTAATFDAAWLASIGVRPPPTYGPRPAPAGPLPPGWTPSASPNGQSAGVPAPTGATAMRAPGTAAPDAPSSPPLPAAAVLFLASSGALLAAGRRHPRAEGTAR
jgi:hypothetical protein